MIQAELGKDLCVRNRAATGVGSYFVVTTGSNSRQETAMKARAISATMYFFMA